jgi:hypothetical protein
MAFTPARTDRITGYAATVDNTTVSHTKSGVGDVKGCIVMVNNGTSGGTQKKDGKMSIGIGGNPLFGNGESQAVGVSHESGVATSDTAHACTNNYIACLPNENGNAWEYYAQVTYVTDGINIKWNSAPTTAMGVLVILYSGDNIEEVNVDENYCTGGGTGTARNLGWKPDMVVAIGAPFSVDHGYSTHAGMSIGVAANDNGTTKQGCIQMYGVDASGSSDSSMGSTARNDAIYAHSDWDDLDAVWKILLQTNGYQMSRVYDGAGRDKRVRIMAFKFKYDQNVTVVNSTAPRNGNQTLTTGWRSQSVLMPFMSRYNNSYNNDSHVNQGGYGLAYLDTTTECSSMVMEEDGSGTTLAYSGYATGKIFVPLYWNPTSTTYYMDATTKTFNSTNVVIPWASGYSSSYYGCITPALCLGDEVFGVPTSTIYLGSTNIASVNLGSGVLEAVYAGSDQVY